MHILKFDMEKPDALFHASPRRDLEELRPAKKSFRDRKEGPRVFASPDREFVTSFMMSHVHPFESGYSNGIPWYAAEEDQFRKADIGGAVYHVPVETFTTDPNKGLGTKEWVSSETVTPIKKDIYESSLEAMIDHGVQVFLIDHLTMKALQASVVKADVLEVLQSVNQQRGKNVKEIKYVR